MVTGEWRHLSHPKVPYGFFNSPFVQVLSDLTLISEDAERPVSAYDPVRTCVRIGGPARPSESPCVGVCVCGPGVTCLCSRLLSKNSSSPLPVFVA